MLASNHNVTDIHEFIQACERIPYWVGIVGGESGWNRITKSHSDTLIRRPHGEQKVSYILELERIFPRNLFDLELPWNPTGKFHL